MNTPRILAGGLLAGLVMNIGEAALHAGVLGADVEALYKTLGAPFPNPAVSMPLLIGTTFLLGIAAIWLHAALLPRFGSRTKTAVIAGLLVWFLAHVWSGVYLGAGYAGVITPRLAAIPVAWGLFEAVIATQVGSLLYKER